MQIEIPDDIGDTCDFITLPNGNRVVVFDPDVHVWNAYNQESLDMDQSLTPEQWRDFITGEKYLYLELDDSAIDMLNDYKKENGIE